MYGLYRFDDRVTQIALPARAGVSRPWGFPYNVFVLHGPAPALIGTGLPGTATALAAALEELGLEPDRIARIVLPGLRPEDVGNLPMFERASVAAIGGATAYRDEQARLRTRIERIARQLVDGGVQPAWSHAQVDAFLEAYFDDVPDEIHATALRDGQRLLAGTTELEVMATPGTGASALALYEPSRRWLFAGASIDMHEEAVPLDADAFMDSLRRISQLEPSVILPSHGGVERSYRAVFRSAGLATNNLMTNLPFALPGPLPLPEICRRDLGWYPDDLMRFVANVLRYETMLDALVRSGVAQREGDDLWAPYRMDRPSRM